jgi:hypothetical protein
MPLRLRRRRRLRFDLRLLDDHPPTRQPLLVQLCEHVNSVSASERDDGLAEP